MTPAASRRYLGVYLPWLTEDAWRLEREFLPGTGRGTAPRSGVVEGRPLHTHRPAAPPLHQPAAGLPPRAGEEPVVFTERQANAVRLTALSRAATALGLVPGLTLADARARVPVLMAVERDHAAEARLLARVVAGLARYTPMAAAEPPDGAVLDITGCTAPYGGEDALAEDLRARLAAGGLAARVGLGDTPQAARARARFASAHRSDLHTLPVAALEAAPEVTTALRRAGLRTIGDLACRPRAMLAARFGDLALRLARLLGEADARISPERPPPPVAAARRFAEPIARVEDALACLAELAEEAAATLLERHEGGRRFTARLFRSDGHVAALAVETGRPTRDPAIVMRLIGERLEALADPIDPGFGFDLVRLDVPATEKLAFAQDDFTRARTDAEGLGALVDRLAARLGPGRIRRVAPCDTHIPECAAMAVAPSAMPAWRAPAEGEPPLRPLRLLDPPQPVEAVMSEVPDGPPMRFAWIGRTYRIARAEGPERIAAEWWRRRDRGGRARDYYRVEDEAGHRFWLFRHGVGEGGGATWYLHGLFA